jgi:hypothetical protein
VRTSLAVGFGLFSAGFWLLVWVVASARRDRRRFEVRRTNLSRATRYDQHLLRTEQTEMIYRRSS